MSRASGTEQASLSSFGTTREIQEEVFRRGMVSCLP